MLVLTRKVGEKIRIGHNIVIEVVEFNRRGEVRLGIDAPREVPIHRQEVYDQIHKDDPPPQ